MEISWGAEIVIRSESQRRNAVVSHVRRIADHVNTEQPSAKC
jgi:hypothetical protein